MSEPETDLHLLMSPTDIASICETTLSTVSGWRSRYDNFPVPTIGGHNPKFDVRSVEAWIRSESSPAHWRNDPSPEWWWATAVEAFRTEVTFATDPASGDQLRPFLVALVLLHATLHGAVEHVRPDRTSWKTIEHGDNLFKSLLDVARKLEDRDPQLADLLVEPLSSIAAPSGSVHALMSHLGDADAAGCTPGRLIDVLVDPNAGSDHHRHQWASTARLHPRQQTTLTAANLAHTVADMAAPGNGDLIYDPCCGEGQVVLECVRRQQGVNRAVVQEIDPVVSRIARSRLLLDRVEFEFGQPARSSLVDDQFPHLRASIVLLDPPVSGRKSDLTEWLDHTLGHCSPDGRCVMVIPAHAVTTIGQARRRPDPVLTDRLEQLAADGVVVEVRVLPGSYRADVVGPITLWLLQPGRESTGIDLIGEGTNGTRTRTSTTPTSLLDDIEKLIPATSTKRQTGRRPNRVAELIRDVEQLLDDLPSTYTATRGDLLTRIRETVTELRPTDPPTTSRDE